jgi:hypothetical protein
MQWARGQNRKPPAQTSQYPLQEPKEEQRRGSCKLVGREQELPTGGNIYKPPPHTASLNLKPQHPSEGSRARRIILSILKMKN